MLYNGLSLTINCMLLKYCMIKQIRKCVNKMRHTADGGAVRLTRTNLRSGGWGSAHGQGDWDWDLVRDLQNGARSGW
jgi:hypothetical protein